MSFGFDGLGGGFADPIVGPNGVLLTPAIESPNFDLVAKTGWAILQNGNAYFFNVVAQGSVTANNVVLVGSADFILGYTGTPAAGNLILAIAPAAGSDSFGNAWAQGVNIINGSKALVMGQTGGSPLVYFQTGSTHIQNSAGLQGTTAGSGTGMFDIWQILGPEDNTQKDLVIMQFNSSSNDGTIQAAINMQYLDSLGVAHQYQYINHNGPHLNQWVSIGAVYTGTLVQGEVYIANAASAPGAPTGGGALYASNGVPKWKDSGGNLLSMVRQYYLASTSSLASFTGPSTIPGLSQGVVVQGNNATVKVTGVCDFNAGGAACTFTGLLNFNSVAQNEKIVAVMPTVGGRGTYAQTWTITGVAAGTYTCLMQATCTVSNSLNQATSPHCTMSIEVLEG